MQNAALIEANIAHYMDTIGQAPTIGGSLNFCHLLDQEIVKVDNEAARVDMFDHLISKCDGFLAQQRVEMESACSAAGDLKRHQAMLRALVALRGALAASRGAITAAGHADRDMSHLALPTWVAH